MRWILALVLVSAVCSGEDLDPYSHLSGYGTHEDQETLYFSNTSKWDEKLLKLTQQSPRFLPENWRSQLAAANPPKNSSVRTSAELDYLLNLQQKRTAEDIERIKGEIELIGFKFGDLTYSMIADIKMRPFTAALAKAVNADISAVMFRAKLHFNRVRPSDLDSRIQPAIQVPGHPAYPSGHATQAFMWAYLLCELLPGDTHEAILAGARLIAQDRELAGVHYPSDTALGQRIARQVVDMWMADPAFTSMLDSARSEWQKN